MPTIVATVSSNKTAPKAAKSGAPAPAATRKQSPSTGGKPSSTPSSEQQRKPQVAHSTNQNNTITNVNFSDPSDCEKIVKIQSVWRGKRQRESFAHKREDRVKAREARYAAADLFDAAFIIQRLIRRIRAQRAAKLEINKLVAAREEVITAQGGNVVSAVAKPAKTKVAAAGPQRGSATVVRSSSVPKAQQSSTAAKGSSKSALPNKESAGGLRETPRLRAPSQSSTPAAAALPGGSPTTSLPRSDKGGAAVGSALSYLRSSPSVNGAAFGGHSSQHYNEVLSQVPERLLRFSHPPQDEELLRLFQALEALSKNGGGDGSGYHKGYTTPSLPSIHSRASFGSPNDVTSSSGNTSNTTRTTNNGRSVPTSDVVTEQACREVFVRFGGEVLVLKGESVESTVRAMLEKIVRPTAPSMADNSIEDIVVNFDQFCRFMLKVVPY